MARHRRALLVVAVVALSAGCLGFLTGTQALEFSANRTVVNESALEATGYREADNRTIRNVVRIETVGGRRQVNLTSSLQVYNRTVDASEVNASQFDRLPGNASVASRPATERGNGGTANLPVVNTNAAVSFSVLAMPNARVGGRSVHPLARTSDERLVRRFFGTGNASVRFEGNRSVRSMGARRTVSTFRVEGATNATDALVHVSTFDTGTDFVLVFAVHPAAVEERARIDTLVAGLEQPFV